MKTIPGAGLLLTAVLAVTAVTTTPVAQDTALTRNDVAAIRGKYWPITTSVSMRYTDRAAAEKTANAK